MVNSRFISSSLPSCIISGRTCPQRGFHYRHRAFSTALNSEPRVSDAANTNSTAAASAASQQQQQEMNYSNEKPNTTFSLYSITNSSWRLPQELNEQDEESNSSFHKHHVAPHNIASAILPEQYFHEELYKSHNEQKLQQLGSDVDSLKREIFLDTVEKDLQDMNREKDPQGTLQILAEFIPQRGVTAYGLMHAMRCLRDSEMPHEAWEAFIEMKSMGAPPSLRSLPLVVEIVKTAIQTESMQNLSIALNQHATQFLDDKPLWTMIFNYATKHALENEAIRQELVSIFDRFQAQMPRDNDWKVAAVHFFESFGDMERAYRVKGSFRDPENIESDLQLFHAMNNRIQIGDQHQALILFSRTMSRKDIAFDFDVRTVTLAVQVAVEEERWKQALFILQTFFTEYFGAPTTMGKGGKRRISEENLPQRNQLPLDQYIVNYGVRVLGKLGDYGKALSLYKLHKPEPFTTSAIMDALLEAKRYEDVFRIFTAFFRPYKIEGSVPIQNHILPLVHALSHLPSQSGEIEKLYKIFFANRDAELYLGRPIEKLADAFFGALLPNLTEENRKHINHLLIRSMERFSMLKPSIIHYAPQENIDQMIQLLNETNSAVEKKDSPRMLQVSRRMLYQAMIRGHQTEELFTLLDEHYGKSLPHKAGREYISLLFACAHEADVDSAEKIIEWMSKHGVKYPSAAIIPHLKCYMKCKRHEKVFEVLLERMASGVDVYYLNPVTRQEFTTLLRKLSRQVAREDAKRVKSILSGVEVEHLTEEALQREKRVQL